MNLNSVHWGVWAAVGAAVLLLVLWKRGYLPWGVGSVAGGVTTLRPAPLRQSLPLPGSVQAALALVEARNREDLTARRYDFEKAIRDAIAAETRKLISDTAAEMQNPK